MYIYVSFQDKSVYQVAWDAAKSEYLIFGSERSFKLMNCQFVYIS